MSNCFNGNMNLNEIINNLDEDTLNNFCSNYCNGTDSATDAANYINNNVGVCEVFSILQCFSSQFFNLIFILLFLYWWSNQNATCNLMNTNCQLVNTVSDLLDQCMECNCCNKK